MRNEVTNLKGTLGLVITDGVGFRNFILSTFLEKASERFEAIYIFSGLPASAYPDYLDIRIKIIELPVFREQKKHWFWRKLKEVAHLQKHRSNPGIADNLAMNHKKGFSPQAILVKLIYAISRRFHSEKAIAQYERFQEKSFAGNKVVNAYGRLLQQHKLDVLFFTHQRPPFIATLVYWAKNMNIPTAAFIFSWDNLASKGRMAASFDQYLVWSLLMKEELLRFYTSTNSKQVSVVGTPQFEPYVRSEFDHTADWFYKEFQLKEDVKTICYSCADKSIGANDPLVISVIAQAIANKELQDCQLLVRTSPADDESRFAEVKATYPFIRWNYPQWTLTRENHPEPWSQRVPFKKDLAELKAVIQYSAINVNMCSTMSLDFMLFDKPVVNTVFGNPTNGLYNDQRFLEYEHYAHVIESGAVKIAKTKTELINALQTYLANPLLDAANRKRIIEKEIGLPLEQTTEACVSALKNLV